MSIACPSKIHPVWKYMTEHVGEDEAYRIWLANGERMPSPQMASSLVEQYNKSNSIHQLSNEDFAKQYHGTIPDDLLKEMKPEEINYMLRSIDILSSPKGKQMLEKGVKAKWDINKIVQEMGIPKEQKQIVIDSWNAGNKTVEQLAMDVISKYSYSVEIKTAYSMESSRVNTEFGNIEDRMFETDTHKYFTNDENPYDERYSKVNKVTGKREYISKEEYELFLPQNTILKSTAYYSNLTVQGGTNYREDRIITPQIIPSIKGHAQFAEKEDIGWFRSDEKQDISGNTKNGEYQVSPYDTKTRRILELQSDLFQKGRDKEFLSGSYLDNKDNRYKTYTPQKNQFLQLLNKDNNWVTFFIKAIVQDSVKKGYEKIWLPKGETAAKIEGHETIADEIRNIDKKIIKAKNILKQIEEAGDSDEYYSRQEDIGSLEKQKQELKSQGIEKLKPIEAFYEIKVGNILEKQFGKDNVKTVTDEFGNSWREIDLQHKDTNKVITPIFLSAPTQSEDEGFYDIDMEVANEEEQKYQEFMDATTKKLIEERKAEKSLRFRAMNKEPNKKAIHMNKIQQINKEIKQLEASSVVAQNIKMADNHIGQMYNVLNRSNISSTELGLISNEIESWGMLIDDWRRPTEDNLLLGKTEIMKDINDLESKLHNVKILHADVSKAHILEKEKKLGYDTTGKDLEQMKDSGMLASTFMDTSQQHQTLVQIMDSQMKDANRDYEGIAKREVENPLKKMMEEKGIDFSKNAHIEMFKQRDKNGKETGKRIGEYSFEFTDAMNKLIQKKNWILENSTSQKAKDAVMIEYYSFYANNMKGLNISSWFVTGDAVEIEKDKQELVKQFGEEKTEQLIGQQKALWDSWIQEAADMREAISDDVELNPEYQSMTVEEKEQIADAQYNDWVTTYNPEIAYRQQIGLVEQSEKVKNYGNRYLISIPIKYDKKGKLTEWYDKNYENMKKTNTKAYEFNEWYSKKMQELVSMLPMYEQEKITDGYLPEMDSDLIELFFSSKMKFARDMKNSFIDMTGEVLHGDKKKRIPVKYMNNTLDQIRRSIDVLELKNDTGAYSKEINNLRKQLDEAIRTQSYDLVMLMNTFGEMVYNYQFKSKVEDIVLLEKHFLDTAKEVKLDKKGNVVGTKEDQEALKNVRAAMDYMVDNIIYDIKHPQELVTGLKMYKDDVMKEKALELDKQKQQLLKDYMMKKLTKEKYHTELDAIEDKIEELGGSKNFSLAKLIKQGVGFTYLKALGYNPLASINNVLWAMATNIGVAISGQEFNFKEFKQAFGIMLNSTKKSIGLKNKTAEKIYSMMSNMGVLADMGELEKGITNRLSKNIKKLGWLNPHEGFRRGEYFVQGLIAMAKFLHNTVELEDGSNINFWEAHDEKGELRTDIKIKNREQYKGVEDPLEVNEYKKLRNSIIKLNSREHGNYDISSPTLIKKTLVGQLLMMFRSWLPNAIDARFGNAMYDRQLGHEVKGRYRTMYEMGWGKSLMTLKWMAQSIFNKNMSEEDIYRFVRDNKVDIANMRRNMVEIVQLITLVTAMLVLWMGLGDDKDEKTKRRNAIIKTLINLAARTNKDLTMYINPMTFQDFTKNTIPALKTMNDAWLFLKASGKVMFYDDKRYNQRYWLKSASRNVPLIGNIVSAYEQSKKIEL